MRVILAFFLVVAGVVARSDPSLDRQLFDSVQDGDFAAVQTLVEDGQQRFLNGDLSADDMRDMFIVLSRSHPKTIAFVENWLNLDTGNHYARIARAWSLWNNGIAMSSARNGWSYEVSHEMREAAAIHAQFAYAAAPDLIPASDAIIVMYGFARDIGNPVAAVNHVMSSHPNWGTLARAFDFAGRYGPEAIESYCRTYASRISDAEHVQCMMYGHAFYGGKQHKDVGDWPGYDPDNPEMVTLRLINMINNFGYDTVTEAQLNWMQETFLTAEPDLYELMDLDRWARSFENRFGNFHQRRNMVSKVRHAHLDRSLAFLDIDPLNLRLLDMVEAAQFELPWITIFNDDGSARTRRVETDETPDEEATRKKTLADQKRAFAVRRLYASPYSGQLWEAYAHSHVSADLSRYFDFEDARLNSIAYATDPVMALGRYQMFKLHQLQFYRDGHTMGARPDWVNGAAKADLAGDILCPFIRADRLLAEICARDADRFPGCIEKSRFIEENRASILEMAQARSQCSTVFDTEVDALWYTPIPMQDVLPPWDADQASPSSSSSP